MGNATRSTASPTRTGSMQPVLDWWASFAPNLMQAQCVQLEALMSWQHSLAAINKEMLDEWTCRWAGGVPIDA